MAKPKPTTFLKKLTAQVKKIEKTAVHALRDVLRLPEKSRRELVIREKEVF